MAKNWEKAFEQKYLMSESNTSIIDTLREWNLEANSGHNDGWVQKHYRDKIEEVRTFLKTVPLKQYEQEAEDKSKDGR